MLAKQVGVESLPIIAGQSAVQIAKRRMDAARLGGLRRGDARHRRPHHGGRGLMAEAAEVKAATRPHEVLLVADALTGQDAVNTARAFDERLGVTGIVLTRMDGDSRGGALRSPCARSPASRSSSSASARRSTPWRSSIRPASPNRILGMGDIVSLVEKAAETIDHEQALRTAEKMRKGKFDLEDLSMQLARWKRWAASAADGHAAGMGAIKKQVEGANSTRRCSSASGRSSRR